MTNIDKCQFSQKQVMFLEQVIDSEGIRPDPNKVMGIQRVPAPTNVGDVHRFMGMANQLSKFSPNLADPLGTVDQGKCMGLGRTAKISISGDQRHACNQPSPCSI